MPYKDISVKVNCPVMDKIETVYFYSFDGKTYRFNGCENQSGAAACKRCEIVETEKFKERHPLTL